MRILITGSNGFVGRVLRKALEEKQHTVRGLDITVSHPNDFQVDIRDYQTLQKVFRDFQPEFIFHFAAISKIQKNADIQTLYDINTLGTMHLALASLELSFKPSILFVSSSQVYGNVPKERQPITEKELVAPINYYGASKAAAENLLFSFHYEANLPVCIVRPFNHTGVGQESYFLIPKIVACFKNKEPVLELGNLSVTRDFMDVRDVIAAYLLLMENFQNGGIFNIASGKAFSIMEIIDFLSQISNHRPRIQSNPHFTRANDIFYAVGSYTLLSKTVGWEPKISFYETLKEMLFYKN